MTNECETCKHDEKYHAIKERHNLGTSHCTKFGCDCKEFVSKDDKNGST